MKLTTEQANEIYDILVAHCGAPGDQEPRDLFILNKDASEYRICWKFGFGGKFYNNNNGIYVGGYPEDMTPERASIVNMANQKLQELQDKWNEFICPECGHVTRRVSYETEEFDYGSGSDAIRLKASIPVHTCDQCKLKYTGSVAEDIRHKAVCEHLGVLTPEHIKNLRKSLGLSQKELAQLTKLDEEMIAAWENGTAILHDANSQYLYLLSFGDNIERLTEHQAVLSFDDNIERLTEQLHHKISRKLNTSTIDI